MTRQSQASGESGRVGLLRTAATAGRSLILGVPTLILFLLAWTLASSRFANPVLLPAPSRVLEEIVLLTRDGEMTRHISASMSRLALGLCVAIVGGIGTGVAIGLNRHFRRAVDPLIELARPISAIAWI